MTIKRGGNYYINHNNNNSNYYLLSVCYLLVLYLVYIIEILTPTLLVSIAFKPQFHR